VGSVVVVDPANVLESELPEQFLFKLEDVGLPKVELAKRRLKAMNPEIEVLGLRQTFDAHNAERILDDGDVIADALGNWQGKMLTSDVCMRLKKTLIHAGVRAFEFQLYTMIPGKSACLRCVFANLGLDDVTASHSGHGVLGPVAGMAGAFQAIEAIKVIAGIGTTPGSYLVRFDALRRYFDDVSELLPRPDCPDCGMPFELPEEY
jgi:molybdopterin/thiamine biosynthesis adenylyltransferase